MKLNVNLGAVNLRPGLSVLSVLSLSLGLILGGCSGGEVEPTPTPDTQDTPTATPADESTPTPTTEITPTEAPEVTPTEAPEATPTATPRPTFNGEIKFVGLADDDTLPLSLDTLSAPIHFEVSNFTLKDPGECTPADSPCGHVHLNLDGDDGNIEDAPYNNAGSSSPIEANFGELDDPFGPHMVTLELVYDDHSSTGERSSVEVNVQLADPTVTITSPAEDQNITLPTNKQVALTVALTDFELAAVGTCGSRPNCGQLHVKIDGDDGNAPGKSYNTIATSSTVFADFSILEGNAIDTSGDHTISVELHRDNGTAYSNTGAVDSVGVKIATVGGPVMAIVSPANGTTVKLGNDGLKTVPVTLSLQNFTLKAPGTCGTQSNCGHIHLHLDDTLGDNPDAPYNNAGAALTMDAHFYWLEYNEYSSTGQHKISISLHKDDHSVAVVNGTAVEASTTIITTPNDNPTVSISDPGTGDTVSIGGDSKGTITVSYKLTNFTVKPAGQCGTTPNCGRVRVYIDGADGNAPSKTYNNEGNSATSIDSYFKYLEDNGFNMFEEHRVTVGLVKDDGTPVQFSNKDGSKTSIEDFVTFTSEAP